MSKDNKLVSFELAMFEWYESLAMAEEAISPLISALILAFIDAGYSKEEAFDHFEVAWNVVKFEEIERIKLQTD